MTKLSSYFINRYKAQENIAHKMAIVRERQIKNAYRQARKELEADLAIFIESYGSAKGFSREDAYKFLNYKELARFRYTLEGYMKAIEELGGDTPEGQKLIKELDILAGRTRVSRMKVLKTAIDVELSKATMKSQKVIGEHLEEVVSFTYDDGKKIMKCNTLASLNPDTIRRIANQDWNGLNYSKRIWKTRKGLGRMVMKDIIVGFTQGHDYKRMTLKLAKRTNQSYYCSRRLIETETTFALERAKDELYKELGVEEYQIIATIDEVTSDICRAMNLKTYKLKDKVIGKNCPPFHPFCRSVSVPAIGKKAWRQLQIKFN